MFKHYTHREKANKKNNNCLRFIYWGAALFFPYKTQAHVISRTAWNLSQNPSGARAFPQRAIVHFQVVFRGAIACISGACFVSSVKASDQPACDWKKAWAQGARRHKYTQSGRVRGRTEKENSGGRA
jgi:hypothetical protein